MLAFMLAGDLLPHTVMIIVGAVTLPFWCWSQAILAAKAAQLGLDKLNALAAERAAVHAATATHSQATRTRKLLQENKHAVRGEATSE